MERLTTGRRHIRTGSVHVSELLGHHPDLFALSIAAQPENPEPDPEPPPGSRRRPPSRASQITKLAVLGVASCVLCAAVAYSSTVDPRRHQAAPDQAGPNLHAATNLSGEEALLPDLLNRAVPRTDVPTAQLPGPKTTATGTIDNPGPAAQRATSKPPAAPPAHDASRKDVVERFYRLVPACPATAYHLLDPAVLGASVTTFVRSWSTVRDLDILDVQERVDDVLAVVRMRLEDGSWLRVQQLLEVADTAPRRIVGAEILSAQRN